MQQRSAEIVGCAEMRQRLTKLRRRLGLSLTRARKRRCWTWSSEIRLRYSLVAGKNGARPPMGQWCVVEFASKTWGDYVTFTRETMERRFLP